MMLTHKHPRSSTWIIMVQSFFASLSVVTLVALFTGISMAEENGVPIIATPVAEASGQFTPADPAQPPLPDRITGEYVKGYLTDTARILSSPLNWDRCDWLKTGLILGSTTGLYLADSGIRDFAQKHQSAFGDKGASAGNALGNPFIAAPSLGLFYLYGQVQDDSKARRTALLSMESLIISGAFTMTVKVATQRPRPFTGESPATWKGPGFKNTDPAFPSAHTQTAFSIASVFAEEYGSNPYVPPIAYGLATLTGLSRIYDNKHWASDVFVGAAIGYFVGKSVVKYHSVQTNSSLKILPTVSQQQVGLIAEYHF